MGDSPPPDECPAFPTVNTNDVILNVLSDIAQDDPSRRTAIGVAVMAAWALFRYLKWKIGAFVRRKAGFEDPPQ